MEEEKSVRKGVAAWWQNKPPSHRWLTVAGLIALFVAAAVGIVLDRQGEDFAKGNAFLLSAVEFLFQSLAISVVVFVVVDELLGWGRQWRGLREHAAEVASGASAFAAALVRDLGLTGVGGPYVIGGSTDPTFSQWDVETLSRFLYKAHSRMKEMSEVMEPNDRTRRDELVTALGLVEMEGRPALSLPSETGIVEAAERLTAALDVIAVNCSTGILSHVKTARVKVDGARSLVKDVRASLTSVSDDELLTPVQLRLLSSNLHGLWAVCSSLASTLQLITWEYEHGRPYPVRRA